MTEVTVEGCGNVSSLILPPPPRAAPDTLKRQQGHPRPLCAWRFGWVRWKSLSKMGSRISYRTSQERFSGHNPPSRPGTQASYPTAASPRCSQPGRPMVVLGFLEEEARWVPWVLITGHTGPPVMGSEEREGPLAAWVSRARYLVNRAKKGLPLWGVNIYFPLWASQRIRFGQSDGLNFLVDVK